MTEQDDKMREYLSDLNYKDGGPLGMTDKATAERAWEKGWIKPVRPGWWVVSGDGLVELTRLDRERHRD